MLPNLPCTSAFVWFAAIAMPCIGHGAPIQVGGANFQPGEGRMHSVLDQPTNRPAPPTRPVNADGEKLDQVLTQIVLENIPHEYLDEKKWGQQEKRWDGLKLRREGIKLETKRRWKMVNHGTWNKYSAELINPNDEFAVDMTDLRNTDDGSTAFNLAFAAHIKIHARTAKWVKGVQLYSFSADGHARVRLTLSCETRITLGMSNFPPDLIFEPKVTNAKLEVDEFRLDRISKAGGEFAQQMSKGARKILDEKIEKKQQKLVTKINSQIEKKKDRFKLSIADAVKSKWFKQSKDFLPAEVQKATNEDDKTR